MRLAVIFPRKKIIAWRRVPWQVVIKVNRADRIAFENIAGLNCYPAAICNINMPRVYQRSRVSGCFMYSGLFSVYQEERAGGERDGNV